MCRPTFVQDVAMLLGKNVRLLRNAKGWEQKDPSAKSGVAIGTISAILLAQLVPPILKKFGL